jgi:Tfp pilus assembly protein PilV
MVMRQAMSMIELVFAIVIMGIAVMSLPLILTQVQNNNAFAMQQEAILAAKAKIGDILTYEWDDNSYSATAQRSYVLDTLNGNGDLNRAGTTDRRVGHVNANYRRKLFDSSIALTARSATDTNTTGGNDIDRFNGQDTNISATLENAGKGLDYVFALTLKPTITYASDTATYSNNPLNNFVFDFANANAITNIKTISVQVTGGDQNITLRAFTCNIGESTLLPSRPYK